MIIAHLLTGPLMVIISALYVKYPPKEINSLYGYRTTLSMKNQDIWQEGNRYNALFLLRLSWGVCALQLIGISTLESGIDILPAGVFLVVGLLYSIRNTEQHLKSIFNQNGHRL